MPPIRIAWFHNGLAACGAICLEDLCQTLGVTGTAAAVFAKGFDGAFPQHIARALPDNQSLTDSKWWHEQSLQLAVFYRLGSFSADVLRAARDAGIRVVVECDSDGYISPAQAPWRALQNRRDPSLPLLQQLKSWKAFLVEWVKRERYEKDLLAQLELADWIKIESVEPAQILRKFFRHRARPDLSAKVIVIPFAVRKNFSNESLNVDRQPNVLAAGRLTSHQKNPQLILWVAKQIGACLPEVNFELHVRGDLGILESIRDRWDNVRLYQNTAPAVLCQRLGQSQVLFSGSRWETTPVQALEALCMGCSLVAPSHIPAYRSLIDNGRYGQTYSSKSGLLPAIQSELQKWRSKQRGSMDVVAHWRALTSLESVAGQFQSLLTRPA